jgi:hypothetical protein
LIRKNIRRGIEDSILLHVPDLNLSSFAEQELINSRTEYLQSRKRKGTGTRT